LIIDKEKEDNELVIRLHWTPNWIDLVLSTHRNRDELILIADSHEIADYNERHPNAPLKILDQRIIKVRDFPRGKWREAEFLNPLMKKAALRLSENGLLDRIIAKYVDPTKLRPPPLKSDPVVLTFDHVGVAFKIIGGFLAIAIFTFLLEKFSIFIIPFKLAFKYLFEFKH